MEQVQNGDNTQRVISNEKLISDSTQKVMPKKKKIAIGVAVFLTIGAIVGLIVGLYFHYAPGAYHLQTTASLANDGTVYASSKFQYVDNNMNEADANYTFTLMFAGLNSNPTQRRLLQSSEQMVNTDTTLHYLHDSGFHIKFRNNQVVGMSIPIDQIVEYIAQQEDPQTYARLLQDDITQYTAEDENLSGQNIYDMYRQEVLATVQEMFPNMNPNNVNILMKDLDMYELQFDQNSGKYIYSDNATSVAQARRRLWSFRHFFHRVGSFFKKAAGDVVHFVKKDGLKILKYGAIACLAGIDIAAKGPSGISDAVKMFKSGNVLYAAQLAAEGVIPLLPAYLSIPLQFIAQTCFSHPPKMHCTKQGAINAAKSDVISYVKKHALSTILSFFQ